jgi:hypothetical protein
LGGLIPLEGVGILLGPLVEEEEGMGSLLMVREGVPRVELLLEVASLGTILSGLPDGRVFVREDVSLGGLGILILPPLVGVADLLVTVRCSNGLTVGVPVVLRGLVTVVSCLPLGSVRVMTSWPLPLPPADAACLIPSFLAKMAD